MKRGSASTVGVSVRPWSWRGQQLASVPSVFWMPTAAVLRPEIDSLVGKGKITTELKEWARTLCASTATTPLTRAEDAHLGEERSVYDVAAEEVVVVLLAAL